MSLTSAIASSSESTAITGATGAKISSRHRSESSGTSATTVGRKNSPSAVPPSTTRRAGGDRGVEHPLRAVALGLVDHRAEADARVGRVADRDRLRALGERGDVAVVERAGDDVAAGGDAGLALVVPGRPRADHRGVVDVGVVEHDERVVAAELERAVLELAAGDLRDLAAGPGRAGEVDHRRRPGGRRAPAPTSTPPGTTWSSPAGQPGRGEDLGEHDAAADRRLGRRLQHDGVAERERGRDHAHAEDEREVPRRDAPTTPRGIRSAMLYRAGIVRRDDLRDRARRQPGGLEQLVRGAADLVVGLAADEPVSRTISVAISSARRCSSAAAARRTPARTS